MSSSGATLSFLDTDSKTMAVTVAEAEWSLFFGNLFIAYGPFIAIYFLVIAKRAQLVILSLLSAFCLLISLLLSASIYAIFKSSISLFTTLFCSVLIQEGMRIVLLMTYVYLESAIAKVTTDKATLPLNDYTSSLAAGAGWAGMSALMVYGRNLAQSIQMRGADFSIACPSVPTVGVLGLLTLASWGMNMGLMVIAFDGYRRRSIPSAAFVLAVHLAFSLTTLANQNENGCVYTIPVAFGCAIIAMVGASSRRFRQ